MTKDGLTHFSAHQRDQAMKKYVIIQPYLNNEKTMASIAWEAKVSERTLFYWLKKYKQGGLVGLIHQTRRDQHVIKLPTEVIEYIKNEFYAHKHLSKASICRKTEQWCKQNHYPAPSYKQVRHVIHHIPDKVKLYAHHSSKAFSNTFDMVHVREEAFPNQTWQADHTMLDIEVINAKGERERPWLTVVLDDYSRAVAGYMIAFGPPDTYRTSLVLRQAIWKKSEPEWKICGIPERFYTDHGSDYTSTHMKQVAVDLNMELVHSRVGIPRGRGKIERFFHTINAMFLEIQPGYIHHANNEKLFSLEVLTQKFKAFLLQDYHYREHSTTHASPIKRWDTHDALPRLPDSLVELDLLLLSSRKERKVRSDGIHFQGLRYYAPTLTAYVGEYVLVRYDPSDIAEIRCNCQVKLNTFCSLILNSLTFKYSTSIF